MPLAWLTPVTYRRLTSALIWTHAAAQSTQFRTVIQRVHEILFSAPCMWSGSQGPCARNSSSISEQCGWCNVCIFLRLPNSRHVCAHSPARILLPPCERREWVAATDESPWFAGLSSRDSLLKMTTKKMSRQSALGTQTANILLRLPEVCHLTMFFIRATWQP